MSLLTKIQDKLKGEPEVQKASGSSQETIKSLNNLPDSEKLKVLEYLNSLKDLTHKE